MRDEYMAKADRLQLKRVHIFSVWLAAEDYPALLGLPSSVRLNDLTHEW